MSDKDENGFLVGGGHVWLPPEARPRPQFFMPSPPPPPASIWRRAWDEIEDFMAGSWELLIWMFMFFAGFVAFAIITTSGLEDRQAAYQQEYGYTQVEVDKDSYKATVTDEDGNEKEVNYISFKGFSILYESQDELYERIEEIEDGTYPENLRFKGKGAS